MADPTLPPVYGVPPTPKPSTSTTKKPPGNYSDPRKHYKPAKTRMAPKLVPRGLPPIPHVYDPRLDKVAKAVKAAAAKRKPITITGMVFHDDQFEGKLTFSPAYGTDAGRTYGASLGLTPGADSPEGNKEFYIRCEITQHRVDPLLQGFESTWEPPPGWTTMDGVGSVIWDEAISNPLKITRVYKTPAAPSTEIGFRVRITKKYKP